MFSQPIFSVGILFSIRKTPISNIIRRKLRVLKFSLGTVI